LVKPCLKAIGDNARSWITKYYNRGLVEESKLSSGYTMLQFQSRVQCRAESQVCCIVTLPGATPIEFPTFRSAQEILGLVCRNTTECDVLIAWYVYACFNATNCSLH